MPEEDGARLRAAIGKRADSDFEIDFVYGGRIERSKDGLFREFLAHKPESDSRAD